MHLLGLVRAGQGAKIRPGCGKNGSVAGPYTVRNGRVRSLPRYVGKAVPQWRMEGKMPGFRPILPSPSGFRPANRPRPAAKPALPQASLPRPKTAMGEVCPIPLARILNRL
jgi:hypothetical protein